MPRSKYVKTIVRFRLQPQSPILHQPKIFLGFRQGQLDFHITRLETFSEKNLCIKLFMQFSFPISEELHQLFVELSFFFSVGRNKVKKVKKIFQLLFASSLGENFKPF